jgi:predicted transporter
MFEKLVTDIIGQHAVSCALSNDSLNSSNENGQLYSSKFFDLKFNLFCSVCLGGVMVSVLASSTVDRGSDSWSGQTKEYKIGICFFSANTQN